MASLYSFIPGRAATTPSSCNFCKESFNRFEDSARDMKIDSNSPNSRNFSENLLAASVEFIRSLFKSL